MIGLKLFEKILFEKILFEKIMSEKIMFENILFEKIMFEMARTWKKNMRVKAIRRGRMQLGSSQSPRLTW